MPISKVCQLSMTLVLAVSSTVASADPPRTSVAAAQAALPNPHHDLVHHADFRVRTQSAEILGDLRDPGSRVVLEMALRDAHPSVRTAAVVALGKLGLAESGEALRRAQRADASAAVRAQCGASLRMIAEASRAGAITGAPRAMPSSWAGVRHVFLVGESHDRSSNDDAANIRALRAALERNLGQTRGVFVASALSGELSAEAARRRVPVYRLDATIGSMAIQNQASDLRVRTEVQLMLVDATRNSILGSISGAASAAETFRPQAPTQRRALAQRTIGAAVDSALNQLPSALSPARANASASAGRPRRR